MLRRGFSPPLSCSYMFLPPSDDASPMDVRNETIKVGSAAPPVSAPVAIDGTADIMLYGVERNMSCPNCPRNEVGRL